MPDQKSGAQTNRIPQEFAGLQVNACKNPTCANFGIPAENSRDDPNYRVSGKKRVVREEYARTGTGAAKSSRVIICKKCGESIPLKNNQAIAETIESLLWSPDNHFCPDSECINHQNKILLDSKPAQYVKRGKTATGNQRWKCKQCSKSFVVSRTRYPASHGAQSHKYVSSIKALLNSSKIKRIMEM